MKKALIIGGVALTLLLLYGYNKVAELQGTFAKLKIWPSKLKEVKVIDLLSKWQIKLDVSIQNPTANALTLSGGGAVTFKKVIIEHDGDFLGSAEVNMGGIEVPAYGTTTVQNVPVIINPLGLAFGYLSVEQFDLSQLQIRAIFDVAGYEYEIAQ